MSLGKFSFKKSLFAIAATIAVSTAVIVPPAQAAFTSGINNLVLSPDGKTLYGSTSSKVIFTLDAKTLVITGRNWIGHVPREMEITPDGKALILFTGARLFLYDAKSFKIIRTIKKVSGFAIAQKANKLVTIGSKYDFKTKKYSSLISITDLATFKSEREIEIPGPSEMVAVDSQATTISLVSRRIKDPTEKRQSAPSDLRYAERTVFSQKHDEYVSDHVVIKLESGKSVRHRTWYSTYTKPPLIRVKDGLIVLPTGYAGYKLLDNGKTEFIDLGKDSHRGIYLDTATKRLILGTSRSLVIKDPGKQGVVQLKINQEISYDTPVQIVRGKDAYFASTDGYRIIRFSPEKGIEKVVPVY